jgi:T4 bacteriophage base plate protein
MALPKLETPIYELILPSSGDRIKFRPFLVKEYKILLTTLDTENAEINRVVTELVDACTFNKLKIDTLANFDIEYIFLNMRAKSIGEITNLLLNCNNCDNQISLDLDLTKAVVEKSPDHNSKINLTDTIILEMRYPKFDEMINIYQNFKSDRIVELLSSCIKAVYTEEKIYDDYTKEELLEFVNSFSKNQFEMIENFFLTMPKLVQHIEQDCDKCGSHNTMTLEGLQNFFV